MPVPHSAAQVFILRGFLYCFLTRFFSLLLGLPFLKFPLPFLGFKESDHSRIEGVNNGFDLMLWQI